jgi:sodium-dependent dicarboxylate transporter 2/3/5
VVHLTGLASFIMGNTRSRGLRAHRRGALIIGFETFEQRWNSNAASNELIAVAWGDSVGGMATPWAAQAVVTLGHLRST